VSGTKLRVATLGLYRAAGSAFEPLFLLDGLACMTVLHCGCVPSVSDPRHCLSGPD